MLSRNDLRRAAGFMGATIIDFLDSDSEISNDSHTALYRGKCIDGILDFLKKMSNDEIDLIYNVSKSVVNLNVLEHFRIPKPYSNGNVFEDED